MFEIECQSMELGKLNLSCLAVLRTRQQWPTNGLIYLDKKKVSGILIESQSYGKDIFLSLGVGVNVNIDESFNVNQPHSNLGINVNHTKLIYLFCDKLINFLNTENYLDLVEEFNANLFAINKNVSVSTGDVIHKGVLMGISNYGELMINVGNNVLTINDINSTLRIV